MSYQNNTTRLIIKDRQKGKTTGLLCASEATGYPIVVPYLNRIEYLKAKASELNLSIPEPLTVEQMKSHGYRFNNILIDDGYDIIGLALDAYFGCHVTCVTLSDQLKMEKER